MLRWLWFRQISGSVEDGQRSWDLQIRGHTTIFSGPCIFSWAARAFLKGVGVFGVCPMIDLRTFGVLKLITETWSSTVSTPVKSSGKKTDTHTHTLELEHMAHTQAYPAFSFWCFGVVSFCCGVFKKHFCPQTGVEVSARLSKLRCSPPDMLKNFVGKKKKRTA